MVLSIHAPSIRFSFLYSSNTLFGILKRFGLSGKICLKMLFDALWSLTMASEEQKRIATLNDDFRRSALGGVNRVPGRVFITRGISALTEQQQFNVLAQVQSFSAFTPDNDPYNEHDFGSVDVDGVGKIFFKIDYYTDENMELGSEDPSDPNQSFRTMTVMLAHEY